MLVQALAAYADEYLSDELSNEAWESKPVPYLLEIGPNGDFLAADDIKYVLGIGPWTKSEPADQANAAERHDAFVHLLRSAASQTDDPALADCVAFYGRSDQMERAKQCLVTARPGTFIALSTPEGALVDRPAVQRFWNAQFSAAFQTRVDSGGTGECLICGTIGSIAPTHDKIKGLSNVGGQASGVSLMSFDKPAFRSYGWDQNANSPVSPNRANAYVLALNDLLRSNGGKRKDIAGTAFIYWTRKRVETDFVDLLDRAEVAEVKALLSLDPKAKPDPNMFYMAGVAGNGARLQVRYWVAESLGDLKTNVKSWFEGLAIVGATGQPTAPPKLWQLLAALDREGEPPAHRTLALIRRAIEGNAQPLGFEILSAVLNRLRHPVESKPATKNDNEKQNYRFSPARLGLLRICLNDLNRKGISMTESLDTNQSDPAYTCGRLLAEYENLQNAVYRAADESKVNVTVADRYYALASVNPQIAFPKLEKLAKAHFQKLRRERRDTHNAIERKVIELHEKIGGSFPSLLSLDSQGRFALGYYHQKAENIRQSIESSKTKKDKSSPEPGISTQEPTL